MVDTFPRDDVTAIVAELGKESCGASVDDLMPLVYDQMRRLAASYMSREAPHHVLQPTAVVHDAYLRLVDQTRANWKGRTHFFAVGARIMRRVLVDHAREQSAQKRGGEWRQITLTEIGAPTTDALDLEELLDLNHAIDRLAALDERQAQVVVLRFFGGMTMDQIAEALGVSKRSVEGDWRHARAWLHLELDR